MLQSNMLVPMPRGLTWPIWLDLSILDTNNLGNKRVHAFAKSISLKVNREVKLEFELAYYDATVQHVCYNSTTQLAAALKYTNCISTER